MTQWDSFRNSIPKIQHLSILMGRRNPGNDQTTPRLRTKRTTFWPESLDPIVPLGSLSEVIMMAVCRRLGATGALVVPVKADPLNVDPIRGVDCFEDAAVDRVTTAIVTCRTFLSTQRRAEAVMWVLFPKSEATS